MNENVALKSRTLRARRGLLCSTGLAKVLASYRLLADSPAVIIGAMSVAMLVDPITGLSYARVTGDGALVRRAGIERRRAHSSYTRLALVSGLRIKTCP